MPLRVPHPYKVWLESILYFPIENKCSLGKQWFLLLSTKALLLIASALQVYI